LHFLHISAFLHRISDSQINLLCRVTPIQSISRPESIPQPAASPQIGSSHPLIFSTSFPLSRTKSCRRLTLYRDLQTYRLYRYYATAQSFLLTT
jgi:hypothetical protein